MSDDYISIERPNGESAFTIKLSVVGLRGLIAAYSAVTGVIKEDEAEFYDFRFSGIDVRDRELLIDCMVKKKFKKRFVSVTREWRAEFALQLRAADEAFLGRGRFVRVKEGLFAELINVVLKTQFQKGPLTDVLTFVWRPNRPPYEHDERLLTAWRQFEAEYEVPLYRECSVALRGRNVRVFEKRVEFDDSGIGFVFGVEGMNVDDVIQEIITCAGQR